ncbi:MAG: peptidase M14 [Roseiflexus castenholzii]|nr:MAG: peptidase M14 [Roseiflexus castenholzii]
MSEGRYNVRRATCNVQRSLLLLLLIFLAAPLHAAPVRQPTVEELTLGTSAQGRPITALRIGNGPIKLVIIGNTHGAPEANTHTLATMLADHFRANPHEVPPAVRLYIIPTINPDGLALGTRFNARGVDLNRNMNTNFDACPDNDWRVTVFGAYGIVSDTGGPYPDSEVESRLVRSFLLDAWGAIFLHSAAGNVFPAFCDHAPSIEMAQTYATASGYRYTRVWEQYIITGGMHDWAASLGIAAIIPELLTGTEPEFAQNLAGIQAVLAAAEKLLPAPEDHVEHGAVVPAILWRFWKMHGGDALFGPPLMPAVVEKGVMRQIFERAVLELHPEWADTPYLVQVTPLGRTCLPPVGAAPRNDCTPPGCRRFTETPYAIRGAFAAYWERHGGLHTFGFPLSDEDVAYAANGQQRAQQVFERAVLILNDDGNVSLAPLGWAFLVRERSLAPTAAHQVR